VVGPIVGGFVVHFDGIQSIAVTLSWDWKSNQFFVASGVKQNIAVAIA
jgi:hypothetical protein